MTDKQWNALKKMTSSKYNNNFFSALLSIGEVTLRERLDGFDLEYPSYSVSLYKDEPISSIDKEYLRYLYNEYMSSMSI
jgi:hypothetical protein